MKRVFVLFTAVVTLGLAGVSQGSTIFSDSFATPDGALVGYNSWTQTGTTTTFPIQIVGGQVALGNTGQDAYRLLNGTTGISRTEPGAIYLGADINLSAAQATGDYFMHFNDNANLTGYFDNRVYAKSVTGGYVLGIMSTAGGTVTPTYGTTVLSFGQSYRVATAWNFVTGTLNDTFALYVNPTDSTEANNTAYTTANWVSTSAEMAVIGAIGLRQGTAANAPTLTLDNLAVGTTFGDVANVSAVPLPAAFPVGLAGLTVLGGIRALRRRK